MPSAASRLMPTLRRVVLAGAGADRTDGQLLGAFLADRDADAFAGLVRRHGPMVLGVCRRILCDQTVAEDAFQAVFIVLARRAGAVKPREQVGNWLYGVAYRTALKARAVLARRRTREKQVDVMPEPPVSTRTNADWADLQPVIDEELARLPDKLRVPVVLCDLEGRAQRDVARHLGIPPATLATRIATARRTLAARLTKRGVTLSGGALAGMLSANGAALAVPPALSQGVVRAVEALAGGGLATTIVSAQAVQLSEGVMRMMLLTKLKAVAVTVLSVATLSGGLGLGLLPAYAGGVSQEPVRAAEVAAKTGETPVVAMEEFIEVKLRGASVELDADIDDATFLRRLSLDLRGVLPTEIESYLFIADEDKDKRAKVVLWMSDDEELRAHAAKKLGVNVERVRVARLVDRDGGQERRLVVVVDTDDRKKPQALAFSPDGKQVAVELVMDEKRGDVTPLMLDVDANVELSVDGPGRLAIAADKDARWTEVRNLHVQLHGDDSKGSMMVWGFQDKNARQLRVQSGGQDAVWSDIFTFEVNSNESDVAFLRRVIKDVRGGTPTALEEKYFADDKDPKKREKLLDELLKDPAIAKKLGDDWKKRMLAAPGPKSGFYRVLPQIKEGSYKWVVPQIEPGSKKDGGAYKLEVVPFDRAGRLQLQVKPEKREGVYEWRIDPGSPKKEGVYEFKVVPRIEPAKPKKPETPPVPETPKVRSVKVVPAVPARPAVPPKPPVPPVSESGKLDGIIQALLAAKKSDADILDFVTLHLLGRLPTDAEKKLTLGLVLKAADRKAAWLEVAKALADTGGKSRSDGAGRREVIQLKDVDVEVIELKGTVEGADGTLRLDVKPVTGVELKPKPAAPAKKK